MNTPNVLPLPGVTVEMSENEADELTNELLGRLEALAAAVLVGEGVSVASETNIVFVSRDEISTLNAEHMGEIGATDVLSFPIDGAAAPLGEETTIVGSVCICAEVASANAAEHAGTFADELALLVTHGVLHLVGHDHASDDERDAMWALERDYLERSWGELAADPWATP